MHILRSSQHLKLVVVLIKPFLKHFCFVAWCIILKEATAIREYSFNERVYMASMSWLKDHRCQVAGETKKRPQKNE
ncbi:hypothetical protein QTP70_007350 [Hemibagrus guttatus]|uniref:Uncharacterized protein n=1 Tax=Hemibagrus guttatus TaxID=175788 RepID=A0AAE0RA11_9TELE|nr:hypothetical protein QTP70_007350 [Hemibagrus guttatus]